MKRRNPFLPFLIAGVLALAASPTVAQNDIFWTAAGPAAADYNNGNNWETGFVPEAQFDEVGVINNGIPAFLAADPALPAGGVTIGNNNSLEIRSGATLTATVGALGNANGTFSVGNGTLTIARGGGLVSERFTLGGGSLLLGEGAAGTTTVTIAGASTLGGATRIVGTNVNFSTNSLSLGSGGTLTAQIMGNDFSTIDVTEAATLGGTLVLDFDGHQPAFGETWNIVNAAEISGSFSNITANVAPGPGLDYVVQTASGGNGQIAQVGIGVKLQLTINRFTGETQMQNLTSDKAVTIDGYFITSPAGTFDSNEWQQLNLPTWVPSDGSSTHIGELSLTGSHEVAGATDIALGNVYVPDRSVFQVSTEDATFEYHVDGGGTVEGIIDYTGAHNDVVLVVDTGNGQTWIQNQSGTDVTIDAYQITSLGDSLNPAGWTSLADADATWTEANPASNHVGELNLTGDQLLSLKTNPDDAIDLGTLFTPGGDQDLLFSMHVIPGGVVGSEIPPEGVTLMGIVEYVDGLQEFVPIIDFASDFNMDGQVNGDDFLIWQAGFGQFDGSATHGDGDANGDGVVNGDDFLLWQQEFGLGVGGGVAANSVPEPSALLLLALSAGLMALRRSAR